MENLEQDAKNHIRKIEQTVAYYRTKLADQSLSENKKGWIKKDIEALEFLIDYAKEALVARGIRV